MPTPILSKSPVSYLRYLGCLIVLLTLSACQAYSPTLQDGAKSERSVISPADAKKIDYLLGLMDQRLNVASKVAKSKWNSGAAVDDPQREVQILDGVTAQAATLGGVDGEIVRAFFQNQFDAGKIMQRDLLAGWRNTLPPAYKFQDAPNLALEVRPVLDKLTPELIAALREVTPLLPISGARAYLSRSSMTLIRGDVNGDVRRQALVTLVALRVN
ncbi:gamma subclass chorismate mutase AroQ [Glaciimonas sp. PAMC28666]|uniref:gamma subclass chorismate mutase AroQ n=1 Tax=Glaciimonas sp. PAMC28666 TaxID=2807626 RepID=UPI001965D877|nr:gamma subclass chorismate mutase AroQ [Glaciimonas sp. PAMC28666]QRX82436.1 gamma subclass chorismate mutase AroQ [Glaciimonas sp. PAMC28666]